MCDYSLEMYRSRKAQVGDKLITGFFMSGTMGLVDPKATTFHPEHKQYVMDGCAVCLSVGSKLLLANVNPNILKMFDLEPGAHEVTFVRLNDEKILDHHDAVRFANGREVSLQTFNHNCEVAVVSLGGELIESAPAHDNIIETMPAPALVPAE